MNIIIKIILLNILLIIGLKYNLSLFIILLTLLSLWMLYTNYKAYKLVEGFDDYKMAFAGLLNKDIKTSLKEDILYDSILDNFTRLIKLMNKSEDIIPPNQMCKGELGDWTNCTKECGRGKQIRRFNVIQKAGETGIHCIYENGQIESKECFERLCRFNEECEHNNDCISGYCSELDRVCSYPNICSRDQLYYCDDEQCQVLKEKYGEYTYDPIKQECINKDINIKLSSFEINQETIDQVAGLQDTERRTTIYSINNQLEISKGIMCNNANNGTSSCEQLPDDILCEEYYENESRLPCVDSVDSDTNCEQATLEPKYAGFTLEELGIEARDNYFTCPSLSEESSPTEESR
uniref:Uncharacterized protein n=1 Tax=viral metagenome TaxID=1070528 RepID=A0A6C0C4Y4_9ZZZZ